jgi:acetolactate synthase-1/2/3 large subunit
VKGAQAIVRCLEEENIKVVFGYPGATIVPLYEALRTSDIKHVLVRQEQAAAHSANGYARVSGTTGVCIGTSGPGATNLVTGIATAYMDSIPMVIITGQVNSAVIGRDVFQEIDITGATEPFVKHSYLLKDAEQIPGTLREAFHIAGTGRPGPVLVDVPVDIQKQDIDFHYPEKVVIRGYKPTYNGHAGQITRIIRKLKSSRKPLVCAGGGILSADAVCELRLFAEKAGIPVVHTMMGIGALAADHPLYLGMVGSHGHPCANRAVSQSDLLVVIGARIGDRATGGKEVFAENAEIIHIDIDPAEIGKNIKPIIPIVGDAKIIIRQLADKIQPLETNGWLEQLHTPQNKKHTAPKSKKGTVNPAYAIQLLGSMVDDEAIVLADVGQNQIWAARNFELTGSRKFLTSGGLGTMGYSLPAAVGAKAGAAGKTVISVVGDGGFQMSLGELGTISQQNIKIFILLFNNNRLGMVREIQDKTYSRTYGVDLDGNPDFLKLAEAYGFKGIRVACNDDLEAAFTEALNCHETFLVECMVDPEERTL